MHPFTPPSELDLTMTQGGGCIRSGGRRIIDWGSVERSGERNGQASEVHGGLVGKGSWAQARLRLKMQFWLWELSRE